MKVIVNLSGLVIDSDNLEALQKLLIGAEKQDYDWNSGTATYYIRPLPHEGMTVTVLPDDLVAAQRLVWKLKEGAKGSAT